jgi:hypothetical protein
MQLWLSQGQNNWEIRETKFGFLNRILSAIRIIQNIQAVNSCLTARRIQRISYFFLCYFYNISESICLFTSGVASNITQ